MTKSSQIMSWRPKICHQIRYSALQTLASVQEGQGLHPEPQLPPSEPQKAPKRQNQLFPQAGFNVDQVKPLPPKICYQIPSSASRASLMSRWGRACIWDPSCPHQNPKKPANASKINLFPIACFDMNSGCTSFNHPNFLGFGEWSIGLK